MEQPAEPISGVPDTDVDNVSKPGYVDAGSAAEFTHKFSRSGVINRIYAVSYPGQEIDVEYSVNLVPDGAGNSINLVARATDNSLGYLAGDDQTWDFPLRRSFDPNDELRFKYVNNDSNNAHPVHLRVHVDYGGPMIDQLKRLTGGIL